MKQESIVVRSSPSFAFMLTLLLGITCMQFSYNLRKLVKSKGWIISSFLKIILLSIISILDSMVNYFTY